MCKAGNKKAIVEKILKLMPNLQWYSISVFCILLAYC